MLDITTLLPALIAAGIILLVSFPVHEFSHALAAYRLGDSTARYLGRLTLDPRRHLDPVGSVALVITAIFGVGLGWAKPTPVNPMNLRNGRHGEALVAAAGPLSNLVLAAVGAIPIRLIAATPALADFVGSGQVGQLVLYVLIDFVLINVFLFLFNLVPIPPLDGWRVLMGLVDPRTAYSLRRYEPMLLQYGIFVLLLFIVAGGGNLLLPIGENIVRILTGL